MVVGVKVSNFILTVLPHFAFWFFPINSSGNQNWDLDGFDVCFAILVSGESRRNWKLKCYFLFLHNITVLSKTLAVFVPTKLLKIDFRRICRDVKFVDTWKSGESKGWKLLLLISLTNDTVLEGMTPKTEQITVDYSRTLDCFLAVNLKRVAGLKRTFPPRQKLEMDGIIYLIFLSRYSPNL